MKFFSVAFVATSFLLAAKATPRDDFSCPGQTIVSEGFVGADKNVQLTQYTCPGTSKQDEGALSARTDCGIECRILETSKRDEGALSARTTIDVCGNECNTACYTPSGGGPDPNDCEVIVDAMRYESQNSGDAFTITNGTTNFVVMTYISCKSVFVNLNTQADETYCLSDWATVTEDIAPNCQSTQNAHGGQCTAADQTWFIEVAHS